MPSKWNERLMTNFLKVYKRHPCLWNPYHKDYYNCGRKNEALMKIIDDLGTPGFTVTDYLHQIKIIREKYKREQTRIIGKLKAQGRYESPYPWYSIIVDMLTKVINDEERAMSEKTLNCYCNDGASISTEYSASSDNLQKKKFVQFQPCSNATCIESIKRSKSAEKSGRSSAKRRPVTSTTTNKSAGPKAGKNASELIVMGKKKDFEPPFLQCPLCGWENNSEGRDNKTGDQLLQKRGNFIPCSERSNVLPLSSLTRSTCSGCSKESIPCPSVSDKFTELPGELYQNDDRSLVESPLELKEQTVQQCNEQTRVATKTRISIQSPSHTQIIQFEPANKFHCNAIKARTRLKIILSCTDARDEPSENSQVDRNVRKAYCNNATQLSAENDLPRRKSAKQGTEVNRSCVDQETQSTMTGTNRSVCFQPLNRVDDEEIKKQRLCDAAEWTGPFVESKEVGANIVEHASKGIQNTVCVLSDDLTQCMPLEDQMKEIGTTMSVCQIQKQSEEDGEQPVPLSCRTKSVECIRSAIFANRGMQTEQNETVCERDTCPYSANEFSKEDPAIVLQHLIHKMLLNTKQTGKSPSSTCCNSHSDQEYSCHVKGNCTIDVTEMIMGIKEFATKVFNASTVDFLMNQLQESPGKLEDSPRSKGACRKQSCTKIETSIQTNILRDESTMTREENDSKQTQICEKGVVVVDREVSTCVNNREVGTNSSLQKCPTTKDIAIQDSSFEFPFDSVCSNKQEMITIGTQKRDPILVRVIKCYENQQPVVKSDKESLTLKNDHEELGKKRIDKYVGTCQRPTCQPYTICRKSKAENERSITKPYCKNSIASHPAARPFAYENFTCDKNCTDKKLVDTIDWTDVTHIDMIPRKLAGSKK